MIEQIFILKKDSMDIKSIKKFPLTLRLVVLLIVATCGLYICSVNLEKPTRVRSNTKLLELRVTNQSCHPSSVEEWQVPYLHYPQPKTYNREECAGNPVRFFCIFSMQRSGSGWFETLLNSHINVSSNGEIFSVAKRRENVSSILKTMDQVFNLDWFSGASKNECSAAVGYKWMLNQGVMQHHKEIVEYFERRRVATIFLFRRNMLRRMVSVLANSYDKNTKPLNGTHKSHVHSTVEHVRLRLKSNFYIRNNEVKLNMCIDLKSEIVGLVLLVRAGILAKYRPWINSTLLMAELKQTEETAAKAIQYFQNTRHIVLYYEDVLKNATKLKDVQEFLGLPFRDMHSRQVKIHTAPLSKQIENWDEVHKTLRGTPYYNFLLSD